MKATAEAFAAEHEGLDFSIGSLAKFETIVQALRRKRTDEALVQWGAYLGESIRRACLLYTSPSPRD